MDGYICLLIETPSTFQKSDSKRPLTRVTITLYGYVLFSMFIVSPFPSNVINSGKLGTQMLTKLFYFGAAFICDTALMNNKQNVAFFKNTLVKSNRKFETAPNCLLNNTILDHFWGAQAHLNLILAPLKN